MIKSFLSVIIFLQIFTFCLVIGNRHEMNRIEHWRQELEWDRASQEDKFIILNWMKERNKANSQEES